jgi:hypothetical protein
MSEPSTAEPSRERPSITSFPPEVLTMIVNQVDVYIIGPKNIRFPKDLPPMALHPDLVAIRSVSRLFRVLVNQLPFWYTEDPRRRSIEKFPPWQMELNHLENHLQDKDWVRCLERRTKWRLRHTPLLSAILHRVPSFHRNATSIVFDFLDWFPSERMYPSSGIDTAIEILGGCRNLVSLEINHSIFQFSLDVIPVSCPGLKYLRIAHLSGFPTIDYFGSNLDGLAALEELDIRDFYVTWGDGNILPLSSAATLTRLTLLCQGFVFWPNFDRKEYLNSFINLKSLSLSPLSRKMAEWIISARFTLSDLRILLWDTGDDDWEEREYGASEEMLWLLSNFDILMSSTSLSRLKELRLAIIFPQRLDRIWNLDPLAPVVLGPIARHHPRLEKLVLNADYGDSCIALLAQLVQLRSLVWHWPQLNILEDTSVSEIKEFIRTAFEQTSTDPVIEVIPHDYQDPGLRVFEPLVYESNGS